MLDNNDELYVFQDQTAEADNFEVSEEINTYEEESEQYPSNVLFQTIISIIVLVGLMLISSSNIGWMKWSRRQLHHAVNASTENTFGIIIASDFIKNIVAAGNNLIKMEEISKQMQGINTVSYEDEVFRNWVWPVQGSLAKQFGWQVSDGTKSFSSGVQIIAPTGADVHVVADGRIEMVSNSANGCLIIVDHSNGWRSIYHNLEQHRVQVGQFVKSGEVIAKLAKNSSAAHSELLFEITRNGQPIDPLTVLVNN